METITRYALWCVYDIKAIIDKILTCHVKKIILTGGEPLIRSDFFEVVKYIREKDSNIDITLMTNGVLISEENVFDIVKNINAVDISLDGYDEESCRNIRGENVYEKVIHSIELLQNNGLQNISLSMVSLGKDKIREMKFNELCKKLKIVPMIRRLTFLGRAKENEAYLKSKEQEQQLTDRKMISEEQFRESLKACSCRAGIEILNINECGLIFPCSTFDHDMKCIGNIMEIDSLYDFMKKRIEEISDNDMEFYKFNPYFEQICQECSVRYFCWTCPYAAMDMMKGYGDITTYCKNKKEMLLELIWGEKQEGEEIILY